MNNRIISLIVLILLLISLIAFTSIHKNKHWSKNIFDIDYIYKHSVLHKDDLKHLKVKLKKTFKGVSLFANRDIKKHEVLAYYKARICRITDKDKFQRKYRVALYSKRRKMYKYLISNIYENSLDIAENDIPYWAYLSNEPSESQTSNCYLQTHDPLKRVRVGDSVIYRLISTRPIKKDEEIVWCYGNYYNRNYKTSCR